MACLFAAHLCAASIPVTMLGSWSEGLSALKDRGVCLVHADGSETAYPVNLISGPRDDDQIHRAVVLVKSWQTERVAHQLANLVAPDGSVVTLQNGLGNREILAQTLGEERVAQGIVTMGAVLLGPGKVKYGGEGKITLGIGPEIKDFPSIFLKAGLQVEMHDDLKALIWGKLVVNSAINPLSAILQVPNGALLYSHHTRKLLSLTSRETAAVARDWGSTWVRLILQIVEEVARNTAQNLSSMLQDIRRGAPTEIEAINGAITRLGWETGTPTPVNYALWLLVRAIVEQRKVI